MFLPLTSVNYDYMPTVNNGYKSLWVVAKYPARLRAGQKVTLVTEPQSGVSHKYDVEIIDIIGTRIVLGGYHKPQDITNITPFKHTVASGPDSVFGVSTKGFMIAKGRDWTFGEGLPKAWLVW